MGGDRPAFVVAHRSAGPVHQLQVIRQGEGDALGGIGVFATDEGEQIEGLLGGWICGCGLLDLGVAENWRRRSWMEVKSLSSGVSAIPARMGLRST